MLEIFQGLDFWVAASLVLALGFVLAFEFINGFHDTANAVATVIYTRAMTPRRAVVMSGLFNFAGVVFGGVGVAYAIVHLLPINMLLNVNTGYGLAMVFSLLAAAIVWNLGTWYFGIPASSSHTLIGSILGVGLAHTLISGVPLADGINWKKALDIMLSLVFSPLAGFTLAALLFLILWKLWPHSKMHKTPEARRELDGKKHPPFWNRLVLVLSAMGVSYVHGSNDGQKGIGLIMLVLIGIAPANFVLNLNSSALDIQETVNATVNLRALYQRNQPIVGDYLGMNVTDTRVELDRCSPKQTMQTIAALETALRGVTDHRQLSVEQRPQIRRYLLCLDDTAKKVSQKFALPDAELKDLKKLRKELTSTTEYAPLWVIFAVALALGSGTMVGWRRVVETVGEKIGRSGMTYASGMCAQIVAALSIALANKYSLPVSTTHVLSSGVAGTMAASRSGLQHGTIRTILIAWALTLPATMGLAALLFWIATALFV